MVVEFEPQSRIEGEIQQLDAAFPVTELGAGAGGARAGARRATATSRSSTRSALRSRISPRCATCCAFTTRSAARSQQIDLLPDLDDPKDLFALLAPQCARGCAAAGVPA